MLLDEHDPLTSSVILRLLESGVSKLPALQVELINGLLLQRLKAPKRHFQTEYRMSATQMNDELQQALDALRARYADHGIERLSDFCAS